MLFGSLTEISSKRRRSSDQFEKNQIIAGIIDSAAWVDTILFCHHFIFAKFITSLPRRGILYLRMPP